MKFYRYIEYHYYTDVSQCIDIQTVYLYVQYFMVDALLYIVAASFTALQIFSAYRKL